jgi:hypothetical protein
VARFATKPESISMRLGAAIAAPGVAWQAASPAAIRAVEATAGAIFIGANPRDVCAELEGKFGSDFEAMVACGALLIRTGPGCA